MLAENIERWKESFINQGRTSGKLEGLLEGKRQGLFEGKLEGERQVLLKLIERRFSNVPTWALDKINTAEAELLETWALRLFDVDSIEDLLV